MPPPPPPHRSRVLARCCRFLQSCHRFRTAMHVCCVLFAAYLRSPPIILPALLPPPRACDSWFLPHKTPPCCYCTRYACEPATCLCGVTQTCSAILTPGRHYRTHDLTWWNSRYFHCAHTHCAHLPLDTTRTRCSLHVTAFACPRAARHAYAHLALAPAH